MKNIICALVLISLGSCIEANHQKTAEHDIIAPANTDVECLVRVKNEAYIFDKVGGNKILNKQATEVTKENVYCVIDKSCRVKILKEAKEWVLIQVREPSWLSSSHIGWVKKENLVFKEAVCEMNVVADKNNYEIISRENRGGVKVYQVLYKGGFLTESQAILFVKSIKKELSYNHDCIINVFATKKACELAVQYPLSDANYIYVADNYILQYESKTDYVSYYPLRDFKYEELKKSRK